jgi:hypothetical protein
MLKVVYISRSIKALALRWAVINRIPEQSGYCNELLLTLGLSQYQLQRDVL